MFLLKRHKDLTQVDHLIRTIHIVHRSLELSFCDNPAIIINELSYDVRLKSFPPDGVPTLTELDYFFKITQEEKIIGFFRVIDLYFYGEIQLHGSYIREKGFLIRSYFEIGRLFLREVMNLFPRKIITATAQESNLDVRRFLEYLNFVYEGPLKGNKNFRYYRKYSNYKIIHREETNNKILAIIFNVYNKNERKRHKCIFKKISSESIKSRELYLTERECNKLCLKYDDFANLMIFSFKG